MIVHNGVNYENKISLLHQLCLHPLLELFAQFEQANLMLF